MKSLNVEKMQEIEGGLQACGVGVGILAASAVTGIGVVWGLLAFTALCLNGDSSAS